MWLLKKLRYQYWSTRVYLNFGQSGLGRLWTTIKMYNPTVIVLIVLHIVCASFCHIKYCFFKSS